MSEGSVRWGILGCARIAERALVPAIREAANAELGGIASRDPGRAAAWAAKLGVRRAYPDYASLLDDPAIDAVYIPLANHLHAEWSIRAARAGKHVLCEKPLALTAAEGAAMFDAASESGVVLMEAFMYRFHPQFERVLALVRNGAVGEVRVVRSAFTFINMNEASDYRWVPAMGGGALYDVGCYPVSAALAVFGRELRSVFARTRLRPGPFPAAASGRDPHARPGAAEVDMAASLLLDFEGGAAAHLDCAFDVLFQSSLEIAGPEGRVSLDRAFSARNFDVRIRVERGTGLEVIEIPAEDAYRRMVEHFGDAVRGAAAPRLGREDALAGARVIDAAFASAYSGRPERPDKGGPA